MLTQSRAPIDVLSQRIASLLGCRIAWRFEPATTRAVLHMRYNQQCESAVVDLTDLDVLTRVDDESLRAFIDSRKRVCETE